MDSFSFWHVCTAVGAGQHDLRARLFDGGLIGFALLANPPNAADNDQ
jgi:hypothetical protein